HLAIAEEARQRFALDAVLFIPAGEPPHKPRGQASAEQRVQMAQLATADHPNFFVSRLEIERPGPSYSVDTLQALYRLYPQAALFFIIGADAALDFFRWRAPQVIQQLATVVVATRPGFTLDRVHATPPATDGPPLTVLPVPGLEISSTELRERIRAGHSLRYLTPLPVATYIRKYGIYLDASC
ncbi:MAG TPA: nicotinate-nucleotide adenylyltransferase, partial [Armatimonadota bacterium]